MARKILTLLIVVCLGSTACGGDPPKRADFVTDMETKTVQNMRGTFTPAVWGCLWDRLNADHPEILERLHGSTGLEAVDAADRTVINPALGDCMKQATPSPASGLPGESTTVAGAPSTTVQTP
jgi:hypothetical protein